MASILKPKTKMVFKLAANKFWCKRPGCKFATRNFDTMIRHANHNCNTNS